MKTNQNSKLLPVDKALLAAVLLIPQLAHAEGAPEKTVISYKYLDYKDWQPGDDRIRVKAHAVSAVAPINEQWSFSGALVTDTVSGASPAYHTQAITPMRDEREMMDIGITRHFQNSSLTVNASYSGEEDYISRSLAVTGTLQNESRNTTLTLGAGYTHDSINPSVGDIHGTKNIQDVLVGVTQVFTKNDIAQLTLRHSTGTGYYTDPYKAFDKRPETRNASTVLLRWNHHFDQTDGSARLSYRYYTDTFDIKAHTLGVEYAHPLRSGWTLTPLVRLHTQSAANFFVEVDPALQGTGQFTLPAETATYYSEDQRLASFGAVTLGLKVAKQISPDLSVDVKYEAYRQRNSWSLNGSGGEGLAPFSARSIQLGMTYQF